MGQDSHRQEKAPINGCLETDLFTVTTQQTHFVRCIARTRTPRRHGGSVDRDWGCQEWLLGSVLPARSVKHGSRYAGLPSAVQQRVSTGQYHNAPAQGKALHQEEGDSPSPPMSIMFAMKNNYYRQTQPPPLPDIMQPGFRKIDDISPRRRVRNDDLAGQQARGASQGRLCSRLPRRRPQAASCGTANRRSCTTTTATLNRMLTRSKHSPIRWRW